MQCFEYQQQAAVGLCKQCYKGLCAGCAKDLGHALACAAHEAEVEALHRLISTNLKVHANMPKTSLLLPLFYLLMGLLFLVKGYLDTVAYGAVKYFMLLMGGGFMAFGIFYLLLSRRYYRRNGAPEPLKADQSGQ